MAIFKDFVSGLLGCNGDVSPDLGGEKYEQDCKPSDGSSVQPDWNQNDPAAADYVKNRTHYLEKTLDIVLPEVTIPDKIAYLNDYASYTRNLVKGHVYNVICDGVKYQCSPVWNDILSSYTIGNAALASLGSDTGEPFFINAHFNMQMTIVYFDSEGTHTIAIDEGEIETVHKLDPKYLPPDITIPSGGSLTLTDADGGKWKLIVGTDGTLSTEAVT